MTTKEKIIETLDKIPDEKLGELLAVVEGFRDKAAAPVKPGKWDRYFGILSAEDADAMLAAVEEICERIEDE